MYNCKLISVIVLMISFLIYPQQDNVSRINNFIINGEYRQAITELNGVIKSDSGNTAAYKRLAFCYNSIFEYQKSASILAEAVKRNPSDNSLLLMSANNYLNAELYYDAKQTFQDYLRENPENTDAVWGLGRTLVALKEWKQASELFLKLVEKDKSVFAYHEMLGRCYEAMKMNDDAIVHLQIANNIAPSNLNIVARLCNLYFKTDRDISAQRVADATLKYYPESSDIWRIRAEAMLRQKEYQQAANSFRSSIQFGDTTAGVLRNLGISLYNMDKLDSAITFLDSALHVEEKDYASAFYLGLAYRDKGDLQKAIEYFSRVEKIHANDYVVESLVYLGVVYQSLKEYKKSIEYLTHAQELDPENNSILFRMAATYDEGYTDKKTALKYYTEYSKDSINADPIMFNYSKKRITELKEKKNTEE